MTAYNEADIIDLDFERCRRKAPLPPPPPPPSMPPPPTAASAPVRPGTTERYRRWSSGQRRAYNLLCASVFTFWTMPLCAAAIPCLLFLIVPGVVVAFIGVAPLALLLDIKYRRDEMRDAVRSKGKYVYKYVR